VPNKRIGKTNVKTGANLAKTDNIEEDEEADEIIPTIKIVKLGEQPKAKKIGKRGDKKQII